MESPSNHNQMITEPLLNNPNGGIRTLPFIIGNEAFERLANDGLLPNLILYLTREYNMETAKGARVMFFLSSAINFMPIPGAFLADTYVGRYAMIGFGCIAGLLGIILLWLTTIIPGARPLPCIGFSDSCTSATTSQLLLLYSSFGLMAIGAGGIRSSSLAFGADQLVKRENSKHEGILERFFSWYYATIAVSIFVATTCIIYIQDAMGWNVGLGIPLPLIDEVVFFSLSRVAV